ncbi:hypothetical protein [Phenylobacterium conjunctum]|uniref:Uncharacterized protein n=1 Tax=Phenylobacterium conjunctum TaxID=1298959 RepID=A0ABW3T0L0_9CAUL
MTTKILATLDASGLPIAIPPAGPATTWWVIVADEQEVAWSFTPVGDRAPFEVNHPAGQAQAYDAETRARFCIQEVAMADAPAGKRVASHGLTLEDGVIVAHPTFEPMPPTPILPVSRMQAKLALNAAGLLEDVEAAVASASREVQIYWTEVSELHRDHSILIEMTDALGWTSEQVDDLFRAAAAIL